MKWTRGLTNQDGTDQISEPTNEWDIAIFAGQLCPGVARVEADVPDNLDRQKPKGQKGETTVDNGDPLVEFDIEIELQPSELQDFKDRILPILRPRSKTGGRTPMTFVHPQARLHSVQNIIVGRIRTPMPTSGGTMKARIQAREWVPTTVKKKKPTGKVQTAQKPGQVVAVRQGTTQLVDPFTNQPKVPTSGSQF